MNNLYRDLAPITEAAWAEIELEATRTFKRHIAGRRVVDVSEPGGPVTAAISTGHLLDVAPPGDGVVAHLRAAKPLVRLRVPFAVTREAIDDVERGAAQWEAAELAARVQRALRDVRGPDGDRGVRQDIDHVLLGATMPAVLVEVGFIDHPIEGKQLVEPAVQARLADAIAEAIEDQLAD